MSDEIKNEIAVQQKASKPKKTVKHRKVSKPRAQKVQPSEPVAPKAKKTMTVKGGRDFTVNKLALDPDFTKDPNKEYTWINKDKDFAHKKAAGYEQVEGHTEHPDTVLCSRDKDLAAEHAAYYENMARTREMSHSSAYLSAVKQVAEQMGESPERIMNEVYPADRVTRAGDQNPRGKKFFSIPGL